MLVRALRKVATRCCSLAANLLQCPTEKPVVLVDLCFCFTEAAACAILISYYMGMRDTIMLHLRCNIAADLP